MKIHTIDLCFQGIEHTIAAFLVEHKGEAILIETGPHSCFEVLKKGIEALGFRVEEIKHVFLTHIHFDHAGAAWKFAEHGAKIYVHPLGAPHLIDPSKLLASAKRLYKEMMDTLWGEMKAISKKQIHIPEHEEIININGLEIKSLYTPGHAKHHIAWMVEDSIMCGDVGGVKLLSGPVLPPCPPPDINLEDWYESIAILEAQNYKRLFLTHFGEVKDCSNHLADLKHRLKEWLEFLIPYFEKGAPEKEVVPIFQKFNDDQVLNYTGSEKMVIKYALANPAWTSVYGLYRYIKKQKEG